MYLLYLHIIIYFSLTSYFTIKYFIIIKYLYFTIKYLLFLLAYITCESPKRYFIDSFIKHCILMIYLLKFLFL